MVEIGIDMPVDEIAEINERNLNEFSLLAGMYGEIYDGPDAKWSYTGTAAFNRILDVRFADEEAEDRITELLRTFESRDVKVNWITGPSTRPIDIGARLETHGFRRIEWAGMAMNLGDLPQKMSLPDGLEVVEITDLSLMQSWSEVLCRGFGWHDSIHKPFLDLFNKVGVCNGLPLRHFFGMLDDRPASACSIYQGSEAAGVYLVAVAPEARRRGLGLATTWHALNEARKDGDRGVVLQASPMGKGVYEKIGFTTHCTMSLYIPQY